MRSAQAISPVRASGNSRPSTGTTLVRPTDNTDAHYRTALREAIEDLNLQHKAVAYDMGVPEYYLSKMLAGEKRITDQHIEAASDALRVAFSKRYAEANGLTVAQIDPLVEAVADLVTSATRVLTLVTADRLPSRTTGQAKADLR